jgi:hypothetical protein
MESLDGYELQSNPERMQTMNDCASISGGHYLMLCFCVNVLFTVQYRGVDLVLAARDGPQAV